MDLQKLSLEALKNRRVAILGYGNQGRAHALNLRDSGVSVVVGARPGKGADRALADGFTPVPFADAVGGSDVVMFLLPDEKIPAIYEQVKGLLTEGQKYVGFAHGFAFHFGFLERLAGTGYFLVSPKGAGAILRQNFEKGSGLPAVFAIDPAASAQTREVALAYAKGIGGGTEVLLETTFQEETECDLFGEQAVLCGGIPRLMEMSFNTLVKNGHSPEMAFFECCYEARLILQLWMQYGPTGMAGRISPTAFYGGTTRGKELFPESGQEILDSIFSKVRSGDFAREWMAEVAAGAPTVAKEKERLSRTELQAVFDKLALS